MQNNKKIIYMVYLVYLIKLEFFTMDKLKQNVTRTKPSACGKVMYPGVSIRFYI